MASSFTVDSADLQERMNTFYIPTHEQSLTLTSTTSPTGSSFGSRSEQDFHIFLQRVHLEFAESKVPFPSSSTLFSSS